MTSFRVMVAAAGALAALVTTAAPASADTAISNGQTYTVTMTSIEGATDDLQGHWNARFAELSAGDPAVAAAFNSASRAAAQDQIDDIKAVATEGWQWNFEATGQVTVRSIAVAQAIVGTSYYGASPTVHVGTVVIDSRTARPIMLTDLFTDDQAALDRLSEQTKRLLIEERGFQEPAPDGPGTEPKAENFANWIPTVEGLEIHFDPYQFGPRLAEVITVQWSALANLLTPEMAAFAQG
jgi:Protein of unknown function (DUF3298)